MRIVVVGGNGFLGTSFIEYMRGRDIEILCCDLLENDKYGKNIIFVPIKQETMDFYRTLLKKDDIVIILKWRGVPAAYVDNGRDLVENNIVGTMVLIEACVEKQVKKIIFASSGGAIYGNCSRLPINEKEIPAPISLYAVQKLMVEDYLKYVNRIHEINTIILRIANPYGKKQKPFGGQGIIATFLAANLLEQTVEIYGNGNYVRDYIYIDDLSECIFKCCQLKMKSGVYNVGSGKGTSIFEICKIIEQLTGKKMHFNEREIGIGQVMNNVLNCSKIEKEISWKTHTELEKGIKEILPVIQNWCRNNQDG